MSLAILSRSKTRMPACSATHFGLLGREKIELMLRRRMIRGSARSSRDNCSPRASICGSARGLSGARELPARQGAQRRGAAASRARRSDEISLEATARCSNAAASMSFRCSKSSLCRKAFRPLANPKSSTGRLDIFTRLITDRSEIFDHVERGYEGRSTPRSRRAASACACAKVRGSIRSVFAAGFAAVLSRTGFGVDDKDLRERHAGLALVDGELNLRGGLVLRIALNAETFDSKVIGYRAQKHADIIDVDRVGAYDVADFWDRSTRAPTSG